MKKPKKPIGGDAVMTIRAAGELSRAFIWGETPQGHKYWSAIHAQLNELARQMPERKRAGGK